MSLGNRLLPVVTVTGSSLMVGCGGNPVGSCGSYGSYGSYGGYGYGGVCAAPNLAGPGYYEGTLADQSSTQPTPVIAIIADNGDGAISSTDGTYYRLNVSLSGNNVSGAYYAISRGSLFPDGSLTTSGSVLAADTQSGLTGTITDQGSAAAPLELNFDPVYNLGSSLSMLAGTWSYTANGFSVTATIRPDGTFSAIDSNNCDYSGAFGLIDPAHNAYSENYVRACSGVKATFTGLSTYFPSGGASATAEIKFLADDGVGEFLVADFQ